MKHFRWDIEIEPQCVTDFVARFWSHVDRREQKDCWLWLRSTRDGYGCFYLNGKGISAHRMSYVISRGPIPHGKIVHHLCDSRRCCNPSHLAAVTQQENTLDAARKGRLHTRLTPELVREIRKEFTGRRGDMVRIAQKLGINPQNVKCVVRRNGWAHVPTNAA